jgi:ribosomal RNA-processing protein 8
LIVS